MSFNLVRNSRLWFTTQVNATTGNIDTTQAATSTGTFEIAVLDGFSFGQSTQQTTIQLNEAGNTPVRGQRAFNTALDNVEVTFSTYMRPEGSGANVTCEERHLWNALLSSVPIDTTGLAISATGSGVTRSSTLAAQATIACSAANFSTASIGVGDIVTLTGATGTYALQWGAPVRIDSISPNTTAATSVVVTYLTAPSTAAGTTSGIQSFNARKGAFASMASTSEAAGHALMHTGNSNKNQLQKFGLIFKVDNAVYSVDNCVADQASIDFSLDGIATIAWTVKGTRLNYLPSATISTASAAVFGGTGLFTSGTAAAKSSSFNYITNKLSTMQLNGNIGGGGTAYTIALTGGNLTISNNVSYVTPANLGVVNTPITYFTGTRSISGNVTAYLRVGSGYSAQLLQDIITANAAETKFQLEVDVGGASNSVRTELLMNGVVLQIPSVETADVISTTINFTAQGYDPTVSNNIYDITQTNDLRIRYFSV